MIKLILIGLAIIVILLAPELRSGFMSDEPVDGLPDTDGLSKMPFGKRWR